MENPFFIRVFWRLLASAFLLTWSSGTDGGEKLYNGIVLPEPWPPNLEQLTVEPMHVPYLKAPPEVILIDVGKQLFVDDFLIEKTTAHHTFHQLEPCSDNPMITVQHRWEEGGK